MEIYKYISDLTASGAVVITVILFLKFMRASNNSWGIVVKNLNDEHRTEISEHKNEIGLIVEKHKNEIGNIVERHKNEIGKILEKNSTAIEKVVDRNSTALEDFSKTIQYCKKMQEKA